MYSCRPVKMKSHKLCQKLKRKTRAIQTRYPGQLTLLLSIWMYLKSVTHTFFTENYFIELVKWNDWIKYNTYPINIYSASTWLMITNPLVDYSQMDFVVYNFSFEKFNNFVNNSEIIVSSISFFSYFRNGINFMLLLAGLFKL